VRGDGVKAREVIAVSGEVKVTDSGDYWWVVYRSKGDHWLQEMPFKSPEKAQAFLADIVAGGGKGRVSSPHESLQLWETLNVVGIDLATS
jgi:hypothetical protein